MGVKSLWNILDESDLGETGRLSSLQGQKVAVDISGWIVQSQQVICGKYNMRKPHLRNLFWRASHLLEHQVEPVFVFDGDSPLLKVKEKRRQQLGKKDRGVKREHLQECAKECCELLACLGLPWIQAEGEAEATCAWLNKHGYVSGVISDDSDCFVHGAETVYRYFTASHNKVSTFKEYTASAIKEKLHLEVSHFVALAMLSGCDYNNGGVRGIGKVKSLPWLQKVQEPIKRFSEWRDNASYYENLEAMKPQKKPTHCGKCRHEGSAPSHTKCGCKWCVTSSGCDGDSEVNCNCDFHQKMALYAENALELKLRSEALKDETFPNKEIIDAFLNFEVPGTTVIEALTWKPPDINNLKVCLHDRLQWSEDISTRRVLPLTVATEMKYHRKQVRPLRILKSLMKQNKLVYEVEWAVTDPDAPHTQTVIVSKQQFSMNYPDIAARYEKDKARKQKGNQATMTDFFKVNKVKRRLFEEDKSKKANGQVKSTGTSSSDSESDDEPAEMKLNGASGDGTAETKSMGTGLNGVSADEKAETKSSGTSLKEESDDEIVEVKSLEKTNLNGKIYQEEDYTVFISSLNSQQNDKMTSEKVTDHQKMNHISTHDRFSDINPPVLNKRKNGRLSIIRLGSPQSPSSFTPGSYIDGGVFKSPQCSVLLHSLDVGKIKRKLFDNDDDDDGDGPMKNKRKH